MKPATDKQMKLIRQMEVMIGRAFKGKTVAEASKWISDNMLEYKDELEQSDTYYGE